MVAPAARACARRASELFAWGASLSTVRCRIQAQFRYIPCDIREASSVAAQEALRVIRRRTDPCPPDPYYGSPLVSRRISFRARTSESQRARADVSDMSTATSPSPVIPPSGIATILPGNESTVVEATQEIPLIIDVPESEDVFAREFDEVQSGTPSVIGDSTELSQTPTQLESDTAQNVLEPTQVIEDRTARIAVTLYHPRRRTEGAEPLRPVEQITLDPTGAPPPIDLHALAEAALDSVMPAMETSSGSTTVSSSSVIAAPPIVTQGSRSSGPTATVTTVVVTTTTSVPAPVITLIRTPPPVVVGGRLPRRHLPLGRPQLAIEDRPCPS